MAAVRRFKREARLAASLNHPNICTILDVDEGDGQCFIAMELLHGQTLKARLTEGPIALAELIEIASQVADALAVAHDQGIIHRDITPGNVFLTHGGLVKILDLGWPSTSLRTRTATAPTTSRSRARSPERSTTWRPNGWWKAAPWIIAATSFRWG